MVAKFVTAVSAGTQPEAMVPPKVSVALVALFVVTAVTRPWKPMTGIVIRSPTWGTPNPAGIVRASVVLAEVPLATVYICERPTLYIGPDGKR